MTHHVGMLYWDDGITVRECINHARTLEHLRNSDVACSRITFHGSECEVLSLDQCSYDPITFTTPDDVNRPAPWYDGVPGSPSSKGYGFWIEEWTGLDSSHMRRGGTSKYPRGTEFGQLGQSHRVWKMNVSLYGADAVALEDLFRWLEESLIQCCSPGVTAWIRTTCPDGYDNDYGLVHVLDAQLLEGPEWIEPAIPELGCFSRRVSFTIGVGDPCLYRPPVECHIDEPFPTPATTVLTSTGATHAQNAAVTASVDLGLGGDVEVVWAGWLDDWTPASSTLLIGTDDGVSSANLLFSVTTLGALRFRLSTNSSTYTVDEISDVMSPLPTVGAVEFFRAQWRSVNGRVSFARSTDGSNWMSIQNTLISATAVGPPLIDPGVVEVGGANGLATYLDGATMFAAIYDGFKEEGGAPAVYFDPGERLSGTTWTSAFGVPGATTWTAGPNSAFADYFGYVDLCDLGLPGLFGCPDDRDAFADYRLCCNVSGERIGVTAPVVVLRNDSTHSYSPPMRVVGITDNGSGCVVANNEIFGEVRISGIPPQSELMIDCARRRVLWRPVGYLTPWEPGYAYLDPSIGHVPDYPAVGCNDAIIFIEPTTATLSLMDLRASVWMVGRYGCC